MATSLDARLNANSPTVLSLYRAVFGFLFATSGTSIILGWPLGEAVSVGVWPDWYSGAIESVTGVLIMAGLFTRAAAFLASGEMAVAYFWIHQPKALWPLAVPGGHSNGGLPAVLFCFGFFLLVFTGGGAFALDNLFARRKS
jgi:putative oxidoreductase